MPIEVVTRKDTGTLYLSGTVTPAGTTKGYRVRQRAGSNDEALAREEAAALERKIIRDHHLGKRPDERGFASTAQAYVQAEPRARQTVMLCVKLTQYFGSAPLSEITQEALDRARAVLYPDAAPGTVRRNLIVPLRAILNFAHRRDWCAAPVFDLPPEPEGRTDFLLPDQVERLLEHAGHIRPLLTYLICTGARLGEALALDWSQVDLQGRRANVWGDQTKTGRRRIVDLTPAAVAALGGLAHREGRVFLRSDREPYRATGDGGGHIARPWEVAWREAELPGEWRDMSNGSRKPVRRYIPAMSPHALRHSWASWWYALTPDPFALQRAGGWSSVDLVERYTHLMPAGHEDAIRRVWGVGELMVVGKRSA